MAILNDILNRYLGGNADAASAQSADDFNHVAQNVPPDILGKGLSAALGSDQTAPAGQMISQMFEASSPEQRAAMLNQLIAKVGPEALAMLRGSLGQAATGAGGPAVTPDQASNVSPQQVQDAVTQAQRHDPSILDSLSGFYAQHPGLVKTLGGAALAILMGRVSQHMRNA